MNKQPSVASATTAQPLFFLLFYIGRTSQKKEQNGNGEIQERKQDLWLTAGS